MSPKDRNDVLSDLSEDVIDDILMRLSLKDAVRTSILARKWRYNWCRLPQLKLDQRLWKQVGGLNSLETNISNIIHHLITCHVGPISYLLLSIPDLGRCPKINSLICFLSVNDIQDLVLRLPCDTQYSLPPSIFACSNLRYLFLQGFLICTPTFFWGFDRLISLELHHVNISSEFLGSLISQCPVLKHLFLDELYDINHIEIDAPKLRSFVLAGMCLTVHLKNVPLLANVSVQSILCNLKAGIHNLVNFFESVPALESLLWMGSTFWSLARACDIPRRLSFDLACLKCLHLNLIGLDNLVELSGALCLIRSSPYLEDIEMQVYSHFPPVKYPVADGLIAQATKDYIDDIPASFSDVTLNHLKVVKLEGIYGNMPEMQLIKILLAKTPVLVRMEINPRAVKDQSLKVLAEITRFQRASSTAEVVYHIDKRPIYTFGIESVNRNEC